MTDSTIPPPPSPPPVGNWNLLDVMWGWILAVGLGSVAGAMIVSAAGYASTSTKTWPLWLLSITQVPLWIGLLAAPLVGVRRSRSTLRREFGFAIEPGDVPLGIVIGILAQLLLVPVISWPWLKLLGKNSKDLSSVAEQLVHKAHSPIDVVLLCLIVVIGAPFIEELFYRGLLFGALRKVLPIWAAIVITGLVFGASHFELLGLPALAAFGMLLAYLVYRTGRLGLSIFTHLGFNAVTVVSLLR